MGDRLRGPLSEFGIAVAESEPALRAMLADLDQATELPIELSAMIGDLAKHGEQIRERIARCDARIEAHARAH